MTSRKKKRKNQRRPKKNEEDQKNGERPLQKINQNQPNWL